MHNSFQSWYLINGASQNSGKWSGGTATDGFGRSHLAQQQSQLQANLPPGKICLSYFII
jgi:hypothetical protein